MLPLGAFAVLRWLNSYHPRSGSGRAHRVQAPLAGDALQGVLTAIVEFDARPGDEIPDGAGSQDLARLGDPQQS